MSSSELDSSPLRMPADGASARRKADEPRQNVEGSSSSQGIVQKVKNFGRPLPPPNVPGRKSRALEEIRKYQQSSKLLIRRLPFARLVRETALPYIDKSRKKYASNGRSKRWKLCKKLLRVTWFICLRMQIYARYMRKESRLCPGIYSLPEELGVEIIITEFLRPRRTLSTVFKLHFQHTYILYGVFIRTGA